MKCKCGPPLSGGELITLKHSYNHWSIRISFEYHNFFGNIFGIQPFQCWSILSSSRCEKPSMHISLIRYRSFETYVKGWKVLNDFVSKFDLCLIDHLKLALKEGLQHVFQWYWKLCRRDSDKSRFSLHRTWCWVYSFIFWHNLCFLKKNFLQV